MEKIKKKKLFSINELQTAINSDTSITTLKNFLKLIQDKDADQDYILEYLESGGKCKEILGMFDKDSTASSTIIFDVINEILLRITVKYPKYRSVADNTAHYIMSNLIKRINQMLDKDSNNIQRICVLKLLTTIATISTNYIKDILQRVDFQREKLDIITKSHPKNHPVRHAYIKLIMAFIINGSYASIGITIEKKSLLLGVINGLKYDPIDIVELVLSVMKNYILYSRYKTLKMKTFNTHVIQQIIDLYNWKGPNGYRNEDQEDDGIDQTTKIQMNEIVHDFLLTLCTSHKYGLIFCDRSIGLKRKSLNQLMCTLLKRIDKPWQHSYVKDLVVKMLKTSPDLIRWQWTYLLGNLEPRLTQNWLDAMEFAGLLLKELTPDCIEFVKDDLNPEQLSQVIKFIILPLPVLKQLITDEHFQTPKICLTILKLLKTMLESTNIYLNCIEKKWLNPNYTIIYNKIMDYITRNFPNALKILSNWQNLDDNNDKLDYLDISFDIIDYYQLLAPKLLDCLNNDFDIKQHLMYLLEIEGKPKKLRNLFLKTTKSLLNFNREAFKLHNDLLVVILMKICRIYYDTHNIESFNCLYLLIDNLNIIKSDEIQIWIDGILNLKQYKSKIVRFLLELLREIHDDDNNKKNSPIFILNQFLSNRQFKVSLKNYLLFVIFNLCHLKPTYWEICTQFDFLPVQIRDYFDNWMNGKIKTLNITKKLFEHFEKFSTEFFSDNFEDFVKSYDLKIYPNFRLNLLQMIVYYLNNQLQFELLEKRSIDNALILIKTTFNGDKLIIFEHYVSVIFNNQIFLNNINIYKPGNLCTDFLIGTLKILNDSHYDFGDYLTSFRQILIEFLLEFFKQPKSREINDEIFQFSHLTPTECFSVLSQIPDDSIESIQCCYNLFIYCLNRLLTTENCIESLPDTIIEKLCRCFVNFTNNCQLPKFSTVLLNCFQKFPNTIKAVQANLIETLLLLNDYNQDNLELCRFLLENNPQFFNVFQENLKQICEKKGFILYLLDSVIKHREDLLEEIYENLQPTLLKILTKPHKANQNFHNFYRTVGVLIDRYFIVPESFCNSVQRFDVTEIFHVYLLNRVYKKVDQNTKTVTNMLLTFIYLEMNLFKQQFNQTKIIEISEIFYEFLQGVNFDLIDMLKLFNKHENFNQFIRNCLKYGISGEVQSLLKILKIFVNHLNESVDVIFEMILSHSKFLDVLLDFENDNHRILILELWSDILNKLPKLMQRKHVPILLSAYSGTKSNVDRTILNLLKLYYRNSQETQFNDFKPFYWGVAAANHYSIHTDIDKVLLRQSKARDILNNLSQSIVTRTISDPDHPTSYDLEFFLPLFNYLLAPENYLTIYTFPISGALSLTIIGLSNENMEIRLAALHVLSRYYQHLEQKHKGKDRFLWLRFIEVLCKSTAIIKDYKLNNFVSTFLARTALILLQPLNCMYSPLTNYLLAKSILDFNTIPELYTFLHYNKDCQQFILEVLRDGCRTNDDFNILMKTKAFKLISELCSSSLCDTKTRQLIFEIYKNCCKLQLGWTILNKKCSFSSQVYSLWHLIGDKFNLDNNNDNNDVSME